MDQYKSFGTVVADPSTEQLFSSSDNNDIGDYTSFVPDCASDSDLSEEFPVLSSLHISLTEVSGDLSKDSKHDHVDDSTDDNVFNQKVTVTATARDAGNLCEDNDSDDSDDPNAADDEVEDDGQEVKVELHHNTGVRRKWDKEIFVNSV